MADLSDMTAKVEGQTLVLTIRLQAPRPSSTGKMNLYFTTGGFQQVTPDGLRANVTIAKYPPR